jgi:hypothetical protein
MLVTGVIQNVALGDVGSLTGREDPFVVVAFVASAGSGATRGRRAEPRCWA